MPMMLATGITLIIWYGTTLVDLTFFSFAYHINCFSSSDQSDQILTLHYACMRSGHIASHLACMNYVS